MTRAFERTKFRFLAWAALLSALAGLHVLIAAAGFFAPYDYAQQNRELIYAPPTRLHVIDARGRPHLRPFIYRLIIVPGSFNAYAEDRSAMFPVRFFTRSSPGQNGRAPSGLHLFGVDGPATLHLAGTDASGRDVFSRLLFGGRISLIAGMVGAAVSVVLGALFGSFAGYFGGWLDEAVMATSEVFLSVPWLYLLLVVRALLPLHVEATRIFLLLVVVLGCVGWARPARLVRGVVLSAKRRDYVTAAKGFGASHAYLLRTHVLPAAASVIYTQFALYVPQYVLAEVTLSFFGLGVSEPAPSWGNMLASLQRNYVLQSCWWMFAPALALILVFTGYRRLLLSHTEVPPLI